MGPFDGWEGLSGRLKNSTVALEQKNLRPSAGCDFTQPTFVARVWNWQPSAILSNMALASFMDKRQLVQNIRAIRLLCGGTLTGKTIQNFQDRIQHDIYRKSAHIAFGSLQHVIP